MKINTYIYSLIVGLLVVTTCTSECMKSIKSFAYIKKLTQTNLVHLAKKHYIKNIKSMTTQLNTDIEILGKITKINFSTDDSASIIGYTMYDNTVYTENINKKKYMYLNMLFVYKEQRNSGIGSKMFKTTIEILRKNFPDVEIITWGIHPIGEWESHEDLMRAKHNLYEFYRKLGADVNEQAGLGKLDLKKVKYFED